MRATKLMWALLAVAVVAQWLVPGRMISSREEVLRKGSEYRFLVSPVDPYDAFRGRYVALYANVNNADVKTDIEVVEHQKLFVRLGTDERGYAKLEEAALKPGTEGDWLKARARRHILYTNTNEVSSVRVILPFDRFYMDEKDAPRAEKLYNEASRIGIVGSTNTWVSVKVYRSMAVVEDLYVQGIPIKKLLEADEEKRE